MKSLDLYLSSKQLNILKLEIENLTNKLHENEKEIENLQTTIKNEEDNSRIARTGLTEKENFITLSMEKISQTKSEFENSKRLIILNKERLLEIDEITKKNLEIDKAKKKIRAK